MKAKLLGEALVKFAAGVVLTGVLLFLPAGSLRYRNGWLLMAALFVPMFLAGLVLLAKKPDLLRRRLDAREKQMEQKTVVALSGLVFAGGFVAAGLSFRFGFLLVPETVSWGACGIFLAAYLLYAEVLRENVWLSRTVGVQEGQRVVDTGLYGIVRHPMYAAVILLFLSVPLVLGSLLSLAFFLPFPLLMVIRISGEERILEQELAGYAEYKNRVRYRLIPFIW